MLNYEYLLYIGTMIEISKSYLEPGVGCMHVNGGKRIPSSRSASAIYQFQKKIKRAGDEVQW